MTLRNLAVAALAIGVATSLFLLLLREGPRGSTAAPQGEPLANESAPNAPAWPLGAAEPALDKPQAPREEVTLAREDLAWILQGRVEGLACLSGRDVSITARSDTQEAVVIPLDGEAAFSQSVTGLMREGPNSQLGA